MESFGNEPVSSIHERLFGSISAGLMISSIFLMVFSARKTAFARADFSISERVK